jgi:hypothetical protein
MGICEIDGIARGRKPRAGKARGIRKSREGSGSEAGAKEPMNWEDRESRNQPRQDVVANALNLFRIGASLLAKAFGVNFIGISHIALSELLLTCADRSISR